MYFCCCCLVVWLLVDHKNISICGCQLNNCVEEMWPFGHNELNNQSNWFENIRVELMADFWGQLGMVIVWVTEG